MPRKGRELEQLIERLEKLLAPEAEISSPGFIPDKDTGVKREVDICIRQKIGATLITIAIECRDRTAIQDVTWIEQLISKKNSIRVDKLIAVSSSNFTGPAKIKAEIHAIEVRLFEELSDTRLKDLFEIEELVLRRFNWIQEKPAKFHYDLQGKTLANLQSGIGQSQIPFSGEEKIFERIQDNKFFSYSEIHSSIINYYFPENLVPKIEGTPLVDNTKYSVTLSALLKENDTSFKFKSSLGDLIILDIDFYISIWIEIKKSPVSRIISYQNHEGKAIMNSAEFNTQLDGENHVLILSKNLETGELRLTKKE